MIPKTFEAWKACIETHCKIPLNRDFAAHRLAVYTNEELEETRQFVQLYGRPHLENIINWLRLIHNRP
jgi:hypothetical protein